jgi:hypothetical protein
VLWLLLGIVLAYLLFCYQAARGYVSPLRETPLKPVWVVETTIPTAAGANPTWVTPGLAAGKDAKVVFVLAHGYGGTRATWSGLMQELPKRGIEAIAPAMPGQDESPDRQVGFGLKESDVIVDAVKWIRARSKKPPKIVLLGLSMGGAATWIASAKDPTVDGVVTEGAYARFDEAMNQFFNRQFAGGSVVLAPVVTFAKGMTGLEPSSVVPLDAAASWKKPALVIQGASDTLIVGSHAERLAKASGAELWYVTGAAHAECYYVAKDEYLKRLVEFTERLGGAGVSGQ